MGYLVMVFTGFILIGIGVTGYIGDNTIEKYNYTRTLSTVYRYYDRDGKHVQMKDSEQNEIISKYIQKEITRKAKEVK